MSLRENSFNKPVFLQPKQISLILKYFKSFNILGTFIQLDTYGKNSSNGGRDEDDAVGDEGRLAADGQEVLPPAVRHRRLCSDGTVLVVLPEKHHAFRILKKSVLDGEVFNIIPYVVKLFPNNILGLFTVLHLVQQVLITCLKEQQKPVHSLLAKS